METRVVDPDGFDPDPDQIQLILFLLLIKKPQNKRLILEAFEF